MLNPRDIIVTDTTHGDVPNFIDRNPGPWRYAIWTAEDGKRCVLKIDAVDKGTMKKNVMIFEFLPEHHIDAEDFAKWACYARSLELNDAPMREVALREEFRQGLQSAHETTERMRKRYQEDHASLMRGIEWRDQKIAELQSVVKSNGLEGLFK